MPYLTQSDKLVLPLVVAPMFLVSSPELVIQACCNGVMAAYPLSNSRSIADADEVLGLLKNRVEQSQNEQVGAWIINMIVHSSYQRFSEECALIAKYQPPIVISALGSPRRIVDLVHSYGGQVWADVSSLNFAKKAAEAGVDGLILLCAGAGGHTGHLSPFAFLRAVREFFPKTIILAGGITDGAGIYAAEVLGADLVYMGTRFIATQETMASMDYKNMLLNSTADDIVTTKAVTGVAANFVRASLEANNIDYHATIPPNMDFNQRYNQEKTANKSKAWKDIYSAGHGVTALKEIETVAQCIQTLCEEYLVAKTK